MGPSTIVLAILKTQRLVDRLMQLDYEDDSEFDFQLLLAGQAPQGVVSTEPISADDIEYKSTLQKARRNALVYAINAALDQKLFKLRSDDNRFITAR